MIRYLSLFSLFIILFSVKHTSAHCEVPCGIYDDHLRIKILLEDIDTMEKAVIKIKELSQKKTPLSSNQLVRWIVTKEKHAEKFQYVVWQYFLTQRVKPVSEKDKEKYNRYIKMIELLHQLSFYAMKVKQNVDTKYTKKLRDLVYEFERVYFGDKKGHHHHH